MREMVLVVDKPEGPTSFDVVRQVKRLLPRDTKVGHGGSLDPFASGVLIILIGKATKLSSALLNADKKYLARVKLGVATDSLDLTGQVTEVCPVPELSEKDVETVLGGLEGNWEQIPPMFSAKKHNGVRLYTLARRNEEVVREPVTVRLHSLRLHRLTENTLDLEVHCSKGTYVRSLALEIGKRLGTVGHLESLRRTECGLYKLSESVTLEGLIADPEPWFRSGFDHFCRLVHKQQCEGGSQKTGYRQPLPMSYIDGNSLQY